VYSLSLIYGLCPTFCFVSGIYPHSSCQIACFLPKPNQYALKTILEGDILGWWWEREFDPDWLWLVRKKKSEKHQQTR
jgi:hypothetical protein